MTERDADREAAVESMADAMFDCYGGYNEETRRHMKMMAMSGLQSQARRGLAALTAAGYALIHAAELAATIIDADGRAYPCSPAAHEAQQSVIGHYEDRLDALRAELAEAEEQRDGSWSLLEKDVYTNGESQRSLLRAKLAEVEAKRDAAVAAEREACAQIAAGEPYRERYRTWSFMTLFPDGSRGNENAESGKVWIADRIAEAIRARVALPAAPAAGQNGEAER